MLRTVEEKSKVPTFVLILCLESLCHHSWRVSMVYEHSPNVLRDGLKCGKFPMIDQGQGGMGSGFMFVCE